MAGFFVSGSRECARTRPVSFPHGVARVICRWLPLASLAMLMTQSPAAAAQSVVTLSPVTPWNVDWTPTTCTLRRGFADRELPDMLTIERFGPTDQFQLTLGSKALAGYKQGQRIWLHYKAGERSPVFGAMPGKSQSGKAFLLISSASLDPAFGQKDDQEHPADNQLRVTPAREAEIKQIAVEFGSRTVVFDTGSLGKAFAALRTCTDDLVASWGLKPAQQSRLSARLKPLSSPGTWITDADYPVRCERTESRRWSISGSPSTKPGDRQRVKSRGRTTTRRLMT